MLFVTDLSLCVSWKSLNICDWFQACLILDPTCSAMERSSLGSQVSWLLLALAHVRRPRWEVRRKMEGRSWVCLLSPCLGYCPHSPPLRVMCPLYRPAGSSCGQVTQHWTQETTTAAAHLWIFSAPPSISWITISLNYFISWKHLKGFLLSSLSPDWYTDQAVGPRGPCGRHPMVLGWDSYVVAGFYVSRPPVGHKPVWPDKKCFGKETCFSFPRFIAMRWVKWTQLVS